MGGVGRLVWLRLRADLRAVVAFVLLVGLATGAVLALGAGARRTASALDRFGTTTRQEDLVVGGFRAGSRRQGAVLDALLADPVVDEVASGAVMGLLPPQRTGQLGDAVAPVRPDELFDRLARPNVIEGRLPDPAAVDEVLVNPATVAATGVAVGQRLRWFAVTEAEFYGHPGEDPSRYGRPRSLLVTGVGVLGPQIVPTAPLDGFPQVLLTPAYYDAHPDEVFSYSFAWVRLRGGAADEDAFSALVARIADDFGIEETYIPLRFTSDARAAAARAVGPQAAALAVLALLLAVVVVLVVGQLVVRHLLARGEERSRLWMLGLTARQVTVLDLLRLGVILVGGGAVAAAVAVLLSDRFPIGPAALAEVTPGIRVDLPVLVVGGVLVLGALGARVTWSLWRARPGPTPPPAPTASGRLIGRLAALGAPPPITIGVGTAVVPERGPRALATAGALVAAAVAVAATATALTFGANLTRLVETPASYGWNWDLLVGSGFTAVPTASARTLLDRPEVEGWSGINYGRLAIAAGGAETEVPAVGLDFQVGSVHPRLVAGRPAVVGDEVVLGARTAADLGVGPGDEVTVGLARSEDRYRARVVGLAVLPGLGAGAFATTDLGEGAIVPAAVTADPTVGGRYTAYLVDLVDGTVPAVAAAELAADLGAVDPNCIQPGCVVDDLEPPAIRNVSGLRGTPLLVGAVLAGLALVTLALNLVTALGLRRREVAVLRALGLVRRQVAAVWRWHAVAVAAVAVAVGLPVGVALGRSLWAAFIGGTGAGVDPTTPIVVLALAPASLLVAVLLSVVPGRLAGRIRPAADLRTE